MIHGKSEVEVREGERGFILILALVTMVAMTIIGLTMVMNMTTDMQLSRNEREAKTAFQLAEAGVEEAIARIRLSSTNSNYIGELSTDSNYRAIGWNNSNSLSKDFGEGYGGNRESADSLDYEVSIRYLDETNSEGFCDDNEVSSNTSGNSSSPPSTCSNTTPEVVMYGQDFNIDSSISGITRGVLPTYEVTSTGDSNGTTRTIVAYVGASSLYTDTLGAINTNECLDIAGGAATVTGGVLEAGSGGCATCDDGVGGCSTKSSSDAMDSYLGEDLSTVINMADEKHSCKNNTCSAAGDDIPSSGSIDTVVNDWGDYAGDAYSTMIYIDNSGGKEVSLSGNFTGRGILIVTGDLKLSGTLSYEGMVYVLGTLTIGGGGGSLNVVGGAMANNTVQLNGSVTATYDHDTLMDVAKQNSTQSILVWKRL